MPVKTIYERAVSGGNRANGAILKAARESMGRAGLACESYEDVSNGTEVDAHAPGLGIALVVDKRGAAAVAVRVRDAACALFEDERVRLGEQARKVWTILVADGTRLQAWRTNSTGEARLLGEAASGQAVADLLVRVKREAERPVSKAKPWVPANPTPHFQELRADLISMYASAPPREGRSAQEGLWKDLVRGSGMEIPAQNWSALYLDHIFLTALARSVHAALAGQSMQKHVMGESFGAWLLNIEPDWEMRLHQTVRQWEWRMRRGDVLRAVYMGTVAKPHRKLYGEYYTPDWLAEMIVEEMLDEAWLERAADAADRIGQGQPVDGVGVLDPCCGSGTFLLHAARRIVSHLAKERPHWSEQERADAVASLVQGIDMHPVAVEMAKATVLRSLPVAPSPGTIGVHQGDAMLVAHREWRKGQQGALAFGHAEDMDKVFRFRGPGRDFYIPEGVARHERMAEIIHHVVRRAVGGKKPQASTLAYVEESADREMLEEAASTLREVIREHGNSVWAWYMCNQMAPFQIRERKVDRIVSNPPWLRYSGIQTKERKEAVARVAEESDLNPGKHVATGMDLASLMVCEVERHFLAEGGSSAFVLPIGALSAKNWLRFREQRPGARWLDLRESHVDGRGCKPGPFHGSSDACVLGLGAKAARRLVMRHEDDRIAYGEGWDSVRTKVKRMKSPRTPAWRESSYADRARQGATILPGVLVRIDPDDPSHTLQPKQAKDPWKRLPVQPLEGIPEHWRIEYIDAHNLERFQRNGALALAVVPNNERRLLTSDEACAESPRWAELDRLYAEHAGMGRGTPKTLAECLDYGGKLSAQWSPHSIVCYAGSGSCMRAMFARNIVEHSLYRVPVRSRAEADYLCGVFNASALYGAFWLARDSGRHFDKTPVTKVPIPLYSRRDDLHVAIAKQAKRLTRSPSEAAEKALDALVAELLPQYAWLGGRA